MNDEDKIFTLAFGNYTDRVCNKYIGIPVQKLPMWVYIRLYLDMRGKV